MARRAELDRGRGLRAKCKSSRITTWRETITNANRIIHLKMSFKDLREVLFLSYEENMISDEEFLLFFFTFVWRILFEEPGIWTSGFSMSTRVLKSVTATQELLTCTVAVMLQKYFWLASVVPRTQRLVLKHGAQEMFFRLAKKIRSTGWILKPKL